MCIGDQVFNRLENSNGASLRVLYRKLRNRVANSLKASKSTYCCNYFQKNSNNMKQVWSGIKSIIDVRKSSKVNVINKLKDRTGKIASDPTVIANIFNKFFVNIFHNIAKHIPRMVKSPMNFMANRTGNYFFIAPSVPSEIFNVISLLKFGKIYWSKQHSNENPKIFSPTLSPLLSRIINESFQTGIFPNKRKLNKVIPLFKKGCALSASSYRPISLSVFSKITEKLMYERLYTFIEKFNMLYPSQFGVSANYSINHALVSLTESMKNSSDSRKFGCGIFLDMQKTFDTVKNEILLIKLEHCGIRGIILVRFKSYLTDRKQYVSINGSNSSCLKINCGVPQGFLIGPLLFLVYINDLPFSSSKLGFYLFANIQQLQRLVNTELEKEASTSVNMDKTNFIMFKSPQYHFTDVVNIKLRSLLIKQTKYVKFLGVLLDENLSWKYHLTELSKTLSRTCGMFFKIGHFFPINILVCQYNSLFSPFLQYGILVCGLVYETHIKPVLQKRVLRAISFENYAAHSTPIFLNLKILKLHDLFRPKLLSFVYQYVKRISPSSFNTCFDSVSNVHQYGTLQAIKGDIFLTQKAPSNMILGQCITMWQSAGMTSLNLSEDLHL